MSQEILCPVCQSVITKTIFSVKDFTVSGETFKIAECANCSLRVTINAPGSNSIGRYYLSEDYISHSETKKGLINKLYHLARGFTLRSKQRITEKESGVRKGTILDIGCGTGSFLNKMKNSGWLVTGLELDEKARSKGEELYEIRSLPVEKLFELDEKSFDVVTMWHVLEHVQDLNSYLVRIHALLKPGGLLMVAVPNYTSYDATFYRNNWAAYDVPRHLYHFSSASMKLLLAKHKFTDIHIKPMWLDSFYVSMLSEKYLQSKLGLLRAGIIASISNLAAFIKKQKCSSLIYLSKK